MPKIMARCEECNKPGGQVPKYYWDDVVAMLRDVYATRQMERYLERNKERSNA